MISAAQLAANLEHIDDDVEQARKAVLEIMSDMRDEQNGRSADPVQTLDNLVEIVHALRGIDLVLDDIRTNGYGGPRLAEEAAAECAAAEQTVRGSKQPKQREKGAEPGAKRGNREGAR